MHVEHKFLCEQDNNNYHSRKQHICKTIMCSYHGIGVNKVETCWNNMNSFEGHMPASGSWLFMLFTTVTWDHPSCCPVPSKRRGRRIEWQQRPELWPAGETETEKLLKNFMGKDMVSHRSFEKTTRVFHLRWKCLRSLPMQEQHQPFLYGSPRRKNSESPLKLVNRYDIYDLIRKHYLYLYIFVDLIYIYHIYIMYIYIYIYTCVQFAILYCNVTYSNVVSRLMLGYCIVSSFPKIILNQCNCWGGTVLWHLFLRPVFLFSNLFYFSHFWRCLNFIWTYKNNQKQIIWCLIKTQ